MREPSKGGCDFGRTKCGWHIHNPVSLALRPGHSRTSQTRLRGCGEAGTGGFFEGVYQVDTCICLMYIFLEVYCLSACSNRFARSASKQSDEQNECGTPSLYLRLQDVGRFHAGPFILAPTPKSGTPKSRLRVRDLGFLSLRGRAKCRPYPRPKSGSTSQINLSKFGSDGQEFLFRGAPHEPTKAHCGPSSRSV